MADWTAVERCRKPPGYGRRHLLAILGFCGFALSYAMRFSLSMAIVAMVNTSALEALRQGKPGNSRAEDDFPGKSSVLFKSDVCPHDTTPHDILDLKLNLFHVENIPGGATTRINTTNENNPFTVDHHETGNGTTTNMVSLMTSSSYQTYNHTTLGDNDFVPVAPSVVNKNKRTKDSGEFLWNEADQGVILGSFFWGYVLTQCLGGWISQRIGGKWPFGVGLLITGLFALVTPAAARIGGMPWVIFVRIVQGLAGGVTVPSMQLILSKWFPPEERGKLGSFTLAGMPFGTSMSMLCSGYLIHYFGWPSVFYVTGVLTIFWFLLWSHYAHASPLDDKKIDPVELRYIQAALGNVGQQSGDYQQQNDIMKKVAKPTKIFFLASWLKAILENSKQELRVPWLRVLLSLPFWAILICNTCETWFLYTINAELPTYMKTVLHFDIKQNSIMSAFPHLLTLIVSVILTNVGDNLIEREYLSIGMVRKLSTSISMWGSAAALLGVAYSGCNSVTTVILLATSIGLNGGKFGGFLVNIIDIAPNYSGILMGIINTIASLPGFFSPWVAGMIINDNPSLENWRLVFLITAGIAFLGNIVYILLASGVEQSWNRSGINDDPSSNNDNELQSASSSLECINQVILSDKNNIKGDNENGVYIIPMNSIEANEQRQQQQPPLQRAVAVINLQQHQQEAQGQQQQQDGFRCYP